MGPWIVGILVGILLAYMYHRVTAG